MRSRNGSADLNMALTEMGPNHLTDFADALRIEGFRKPRKKGIYLVWESIGAFRTALVDFLQGKAHAFIGGVAARSYKAREVPTVDYDVMIARKHLKEITAFL